MTVDYDMPHGRKDDDVDELEELQAAASTARSVQRPDVDQDEADTAESFELPGADLSGESLVVRVEPQQSDEFACTRCFLVHHRSQLAEADPMVCRDCA